jgi:hypothetical protein
MATMHYRSRQPREQWPGVDDPPAKPLWPTWLVLLIVSWCLVGAIVFGLTPWLADLVIL